MVNGLVVRTMSEADFEAAAAVLVGAFGRWPSHDIDVSPADHLRWKLSGPGNDLAYQYVAEVDGRVVGTRFCLISRVKLGDVVFPARQSMDIAVLPEFRRRGIFEQTRQSRANVDDLSPVGISAGSSDDYQRARRRKPRLGRTEWRVYFYLDRLIRPLDAGRLGPARGWPRWQRPGRRLLLAGASLANTVAAPRYPRLPADGPIEIRQIGEADARFDGLWEAASPSFRGAVVRDARYLAWRYFDPRGGRYHVLGALDGNSLLGYLALGSLRGAAFVTDLFAPGDRSEVADALIGGALALARELGQPAVECWLHHRHPAYAVARRRGFFPMPGRRRMSVRSRRDIGVDGPTLLADPAGVHLMAGDIDFV